MAGKHLPRIEAEVIPHRKERYNTPDDYYKKGNKAIFKISKFKDKDYEFLMLVHALVEWYLTEKRGISEKIISRFDREHLKLDDPGRNKKAPYRKEHMFAEKIEKIISKELGADWKNYCENFREILAKGRKDGV